MSAVQCLGFHGSACHADERCRVWDSIGNANSTVKEGQLAKAVVAKFVSPKRHHPSNVLPELSIRQ